MQAKDAPKGFSNPAVLEARSDCSKPASSKPLKLVVLMLDDLCCHHQATCYKTRFSTLHDQDGTPGRGLWRTRVAHSQPAPPATWLHPAHGF